MAKLITEFFWHIVQLYGTPVWTRIWRVRTTFLLNVLKHSLHWKGLSRVWLSMWLFNKPRHLNFFGHSLQWNCWIPEWMNIWSVSWYFVMNFFGHSLQPYGFSPACMSVCRLRSKRFHSGMNKHVSVITTFVFETLWTNVAFIRFFCRMNALVLCYMTLWSKF